MKKKYTAILFLFVSYLSFGQIISEIDADQDGADDAEFVEIFWTPDTSLDGHILVFFNGTGDVSYRTVDLAGETTDANGFYLLSPTFSIQNGPDAVALYLDSASNFPNGTSPTTVNLVDAIVYSNNSTVDNALLTALGETIQYTDTTTESLQAQSDGTFLLGAPTPGTTNVLSVDIREKNTFSIYPNPTTTDQVTISSIDASPITVAVFDVLGKQVKNEIILNNKLQISNLKSGIYLLRISQNGATSTKKLVIR